MLLTDTAIRALTPGDKPIKKADEKGLWMGGPVPLGYQVIERKLVPVPEEAERVRVIMRRYLEVRNVPALIEILRAEGVVTKVQQRSSGPHKGGISFARGSLFYLLKNAVYRGKIVHKGQVDDGEHEAIVDKELWDAVQSQLREKAPPRKRSRNEPQHALLTGMISDRHGRPMVPTYGSSKVKRYTYYETRKDRARPGDPPATRYQRGHLEQHIIGHLEQLLTDEHVLRRLSGIEEASQLRTLFANAHLLAMQLREIGRAETAVRLLVSAMAVQAENIEVLLDPAALGIASDTRWTWSMPLPARKPFREARLRIDAEASLSAPSTDLLDLVSEAMDAQRLVLASPELSLNQLAKREGRCRTQLARLPPWAASPPT